MNQPQRKLGAFDSYVMDAQEKELRAQYDRFCADLKRNLAGVEGEYFAAPSFAEWKAWSSHE